jgi:hypothetical protein
MIVFHIRLIVNIFVIHMDWEYIIKTTSNFDVVSYVPVKYNQA